MLTKKLACPSCGVKLRIADTLPAGKRIQCPKCSNAFPVPAADEEPAPPPKLAVARPRKALPPSEENRDRDHRVQERPVARSRKKPPPLEEEDRDEEVEERPVPRKRRKKRKKTTNRTPLIVGLVLGGVVFLVGAAGLAWHFSKKGTTVAETSKPGPSAPAVATRASAPGPGAGSEAAGPGAGPEATGSGPGGGEVDQFTAGRRVFEDNNCTRCHSLSGGGSAASGGGGRGGNRGPSLAAVGRDPAHTVDWLMEHIRNPKAHRPDSRMPPFEGKIQAQDLRALATYLASLK
jgi:mono/diheme cytochrome c family protein